MTDQKKDPLGKLRRKLSVQNHNHNRAQKNISKLRAIAKVGGIARGMFKRGSVSTKNAIKANRDKHLGRPGLYRSCRPVHAFDTDATVAITKSWGVSTSNSGDFVVVGEPKASTNWMNDIYSVPRTEFLTDFQSVPGVFHEYRRTGTFFAWTTEPEYADGVTPNQNTDWTPPLNWHVFVSSTGESLRKGDEDFTMKDGLFQEAFEPVFVDHPAAHEVMCEVVRIIQEEDPESRLSTLGFRGANTLHVLKAGEVALVTGGQFKIGRMGAQINQIEAKKKKKRNRRMSFMPTEMRLTTKAYMAGESMGPFPIQTEVVTVTELASELFVITQDVMSKFSEDALQSVEELASHVNASDNPNYINENPAEKLDRICREFFRMCDDDSSGEISPIEFNRVMRKQAKKFGPQFKDWFNRPLVIFEQIDEDGSGTIDEEEFVVYATKRGDAMMLGLIMGATAHGDESAAKNVEVAQRQATDALVESLRTQVFNLESRVTKQRLANLDDMNSMFDVVTRTLLTEL